MMDFAPGMRVIIRDEEWMIKKAEKNTMGVYALHCTGVSSLVKDRNAIFMADIEEIIPVDPAKMKLVVDESPKYRDTLLYLESQWRQRTPTDNKIHIGNRAAMDTMNYQLEPAQVALKKPRQRILIADAVGLGKTLEAGILMSELIMRGKGKRILVVTGKSMMTQFQKEMWNRFTIPLVRLDSNKIRQIRAKLPSNYNPFFYYDKTIISVDTLKNDVAYRKHLESATWDIIVIDEAQSVATRGERNSQRAKLAELLANRSDSMIMLSATPHDGKAKSFASLMNMLDPTAVANQEDYTADDIKGLFVRRFKKDVKNQMSGVVLERNLAEEKCRATKEEEAVYDIFTDLKLDMDIESKRGKGTLFKTALEKALFSSPAACMKTIDARLKKLRKKYDDDEIKDIRSLENLSEALGKVTAKKFSRYQKLLGLLGSKEYNWNRQADDDRIVIFTERIDTMEYLYQNLAADLNLEKGAIEKISGAMSDEEQQRIVEDFGRAKAKVRILVASDVASEGLNLHYMSHRMIHFDLPWSLMVFQQRNGRIDRYGQTRQPDIRYLVTETDNEKIKGDIRLLQILIEKEEQAVKNIGDPSTLLGKFAVEEEEAVVSGAIEVGQSADDFGKMMEANIAEFNPLEALLAAATVSKEESPQVSEEETLYNDTEYLFRAMKYFNRNEDHSVQKLEAVKGLDIGLSDDMRHRLATALPKEVVEVFKDKSYLRLVSDREYCMNEVKRCQKEKTEQIYPEAQYLWPLHPIFDWVNDKASLIFSRDEAPLGVLANLPANNTIFLMNGSFPNQKSTSLVDEWFGLRYENGKFVEAMPIREALSYGKLRSGMEFPNPIDRDSHYSLEKEFCQALLPNAVEQAKKYMMGFYRRYREKMKPQIDEELEKLTELEDKHREYQISLFQHRNERKLNENLRRVDELFDDFKKWVEESMNIEARPYIRVIAVLTARGGKQRG